MASVDTTYSAVTDIAPEALSFHELYRGHVQQVARWTHRLAGPSLDVEDLVQEIFLIAYRQLPSFRGEAAYSTWLYGIAANVVRDARRKHKVRALFQARLEEAAPAAEPAALAPEQLAQHQERARIDRALDQLSERHRTLLVLHELEGMKGEEIAALLKANPSTIWVQLHRARKGFAKALAAQDAKEHR